MCSRKDETLNSTGPGSSQDAVKTPDSPERLHRTVQMRSAPFNPENLGGPVNAPDVYDNNEGVYRVNIAMFEPPQPTAAKDAEATDHDVRTKAKMDPQYIIPRPIVDPVPAEIHGRVSPVPDYASEDSSSTITHL